MNPFGRRSWAVVIFTALLIVIVNLTWWLFYLKTEKSFEDQLSRRLATLARIGASEFSQESVSALVDGYLWAYDEALNVIENIRAADSLSEVFILDINRHYLATTSAYADSIYYLADLNDAAIDSAFVSLDYDGQAIFSGRPVVTAGYRSGSLILKSAFAPLVDTTGLVAAVLGVEADVDYADDLLALRRSLYLSSIISVGIGLLFGVLFYVIQRRIAASEKSVFMSQSQANLGRMVAVVSHEIKNPLMIMRASAESLIKKVNSPEAGFIVEEIDRLNQIVTGYLDFASGKSIISREPLDIVGFLNSIAGQFAPRLARDKISLETRLPNSRLMIKADSIALRQVIINLILNAAEAVAGKDNAAVTLSLEQAGGRTVIKVIDNGPGIERKQLKNIFEPFFTTKTTGSGLGLFHSRRLIGKMGGEIKADSKVGGSTEFSIVLPDADNGE